MKSQIIRVHNIKRTVLALLVLLLLTAPAAVQAQSGSGDGFDYSVNSSNANTITLTNYFGPGGAVTIPTSINGLTVTGIAPRTEGYGLGEEIFSMFSTNVTSVTIPCGVTSIGENALSDPALTNVTIPDSVTIIGRGAFSDCTSLTSITIPDGVTSIGEGAFYSCINLTNVIISDGVTSIGGTAFCNCTNLTSITIPNSVTNIEWASDGQDGPSGAFEGCTSLTNVTIGNGVISIGKNAFQDCINLAGVYFIGNAPPFPLEGLDQPPIVFEGDNNVTAYYLPDTTGWSNTFAGVPTMLWNPLIQTGDGSFGVQNNQFGFNITGTNNFTVVVEACTNLTNPGWTPIQTVTLTNGSYYFTDPQWTNYPSRFYGLGLP